MSEQENQRLISQHVTLLNSFIPNLKTLYEILCSGTFNFYLPKFNTLCINKEYLMNLQKRAVFVLTNEEIKEFCNKKIIAITRLELFQELDKYCNNKKIGLSFHTETLPDKDWMINVLFTIDPENARFNRIDLELYREISKE